ncbi:MAG: acetyl-CoA carboxylase biotin carboxyl carrier protein subunit [Silvanigrellaceae bacterium]|nr:acetyl-CoA carboxylase biotin carboxyl carrier protein subunit [Silvanigrellaceae bacterium]
MRYIVQTKKEEHSILVEIPDTLYLNSLHVGEEFVISFSQDLGKTFKVTTACFLASKSALLIENKVFRMSELAQNLSVGLFKSIKPKRQQSIVKSGELKSPMTGKVLALRVVVGQQIQKGEVLVVVEAMKMENTLCAEFDGTVQSIYVTEGKNVAFGETLLIITPSFTLPEHTTTTASIEKN